MKTQQVLVGAAIIAFSMASRSPASVYEIDPEHSSVVLRATHLGVGTVEGRFDDFAGTIEFDSTDVMMSKVFVNIRSSSINTNQQERDKHLRSADFLNADKYPLITYESTEVAEVGLDGIRIVGNLSLHGVTHRVVLPVRLRGYTQDMDGKRRIAFDTSTQINRKDYGMTWNRMVVGNELVGQVITIFLNVEGVEKVDAIAK